jgi:hypothetical protein
MAEGANPVELSSDPGDLCRAYDEYIAYLETQLLGLLHA